VPRSLASSKFLMYPFAGQIDGHDRSSANKLSRAAIIRERVGAWICVRRLSTCHVRGSVRTHIHEGRKSPSRLLCCNDKINSPFARTRWLGSRSCRAGSEAPSAGDSSADGRASGSDLDRASIGARAPREPDRLRLSRWQEEPDAVQGRSTRRARTLCFDESLTRRGRSWIACRWTASRR
jgi:hypothetical protein